MLEHSVCHLERRNNEDEVVPDYLDESKTMLVLLWDYIHDGTDNIDVLDRIMKLQRLYGSDKIVALLGNYAGGSVTLKLYLLL